MKRGLSFLFLLMALMHIGSTGASAQGNVTFQDGWPRPNSTVRDMLLSDGVLYFVGNFSDVGGVPRGGGGAIDVATGTLLPWNPNSSVYVNVDPYGPISIAKKGDTIFLAGYFSTLGGQPANCFGAVDATTGTRLAWGPTLSNGSSTYYAIQAQKVYLNSNTLYLGGLFDSVGGAYRRSLAAIDATTGTVLPFNADIGGFAIQSVSDLKCSGNILYIAGGFGTVNGQSRAQIASVDAITGAVTSWNPAGIGGYTEPGASRLAISGNTVYVLGVMRYIQGQYRNSAYAVDATTGILLPWDPALSSPARSIAVSGNTVYLGGSFSRAGNPQQSRRGLAAVDATTGALKSWNPQAFNFVNRILPVGNTVYVGGDMDVVGGDSTRKKLVAVSAQSDIVPGATAASQTSGCGPGFTVNLSLNGTSGAETYQWQRSTNDTMWTNIAGATDSTYSLYVSDSTYFRCKLGAAGTPDDYSAKIWVTVNKPTPYISINAPSVICYGGNDASFTSLGGLLGTSPVYTWRVDGAVVQSGSASNFISNNISKYDSSVVTLTVSNINTACATATTISDTVKVKAVATPNPVVTASGTRIFCEGGSVILSNMPNAASTYSFSWKDADANEVSTAYNYTATQSGTYTFTITDPQTLCTRTATPQVVTVKPIPVVYASVNGSLALCPTSSVILSNSVTENGVTYRWKRDGVTNVSTTSYYNAKTAGSYTLTAALNGCADTSAAYNVTVIPVPDVTVTVNGPMALCPDTNVLLSAVNNAGYAYQWYNGANPIDGQTTGEYLATTAGSYKVAVSNEGCAPKNSAATKVTSTTLPTATITQTASSNSSVTLRGNNGTVYGYQWYLNDSPIANATSQTYTATINGSYTLELKRNNCSVMSNVKTVAGLTGTSRLAVAEEAQVAISVYPNPSEGVFNIASEEAVNVIVRDVQGRVIANMSNATTVDLTAQPAGIYLMQIMDAKGNLLQSERLIRK